MSTAAWVIAAMVGGIVLLSSPDEPDTPQGGTSAGVEIASVAPSPVRSTTAARVPYEVTASSLRLRIGPSTTAAVVGSAVRGTRVDVLGRQGSWADVRLPDGTHGWMSGTYLTPSSLWTERAEQAASNEPAELSAYADAIGRATITDGDTIRIGDARIRLEGIDAPESGQACEDAAGRLYPCGGRAANALDDLIDRRTVACRRDDTDRYGRMVGTCIVLATGESLNMLMVRTGWALAYRRYSTAYVPQEAAAQAEKKGLWQGRFVPPWDYRAGVRLTRGEADAENTASPLTEQAVPTSVGSGSCTIKGNISGSGRIYHLPGTKWYDRMRIDTGRGERWFCSEDEARAAGWRAPRG